MTIAPLRCTVMCGQSSVMISSLHNFHPSETDGDKSSEDSVQFIQGGKAAGSKIKGVSRTVLPAYGMHLSPEF